MLRKVTTDTGRGIVQSPRCGKVEQQKGDWASDRMRFAFVSSLLGILAHVVGVAATSEEDIKVSVSVWPPGSNIFVGECVFLQCTVESNTSLVWSYRWFKQKPQPGPTPRRRHLIAGDSYIIAAVTRQDADGYWCQAERRLGNTSSVVLLSQPTTFTVSEQPMGSLTLTPNSRQVHTGQRFTLRCPQARTNSSGWVLRHFSPGRRVRKRILHTDWCSPLGGAVGADVSDTCTFTAASEHAGLYWCEGVEGRSNAIYITVSSGLLILRSPAIPVSEGDSVVLQCQYLTANHRDTIFFKNAAEVFTFNSSSHAQVVKMTLENVTQKDEGYYKCASRDREMESPESWLSVRPQGGNFTDWTAVPAGGSQTWIPVSCALVLLVLIPLTACSVHHYRAQIFSAGGCWPSSPQQRAAVGFPATKQDATEVQWDLSWMEMSNLLDKHSHLGT